MTVCVFGSINLDVTAYMDRLPKPGETLHGREYKLGLGGKGANQAVAARKLGSDVRLICRLGVDDFSEPARRELSSYGVDLSLVRQDPEGATGIAIINVGEGGENYISLIGGSNLSMDDSDVDRGQSALEEAQELEAVVEAFAGRQRGPTSGTRQTSRLHTNDLTPRRAKLRHRSAVAGRRDRAPPAEDHAATAIPAIAHQLAQHGQACER